MTRTLAVVLALVAAGPVVAQTQPVVDSAWDASPDAPRPKTVDIGVPRKAGTLELKGLRALAPDGFDNGALYQSPDGKVFATAYVYRPGFPDPSYTLLMTGSAIEARFPGARAAPEELVMVNGVPALHKRIYAGGRVPIEGGGSGEVTTIAGALRAVDWIVKLRATGPAPRHDEVVAAFDALVAGLRFGPGAKPLASALDTVGRCPERDGVKPARLAAAPAEKGGLMALQKMVMAAVNPIDPKAPRAPRKLCEVARQAGQTGLSLVLSEEGRGYPTIMLLGDAGNAIVSTPAVAGLSGWGVISATRAGATMFGPFDRAPTAAQLLGVANGSDFDWAGKGIARMTRDAKGQANIQISPP